MRFAKKNRQNQPEESPSRSSRQDRQDCRLVANSPWNPSVQIRIWLDGF